MEKKELKRNIVNSLIAILIILLISGSIIIANYQNSALLIGLSNQTEKQMMGYFIKTREHLIAIDGGTKGDAENFLKHAKENGGKIDYWFITHLHDDHMGTFIEVMKNNKIPVENIILSINDLEWYKQNDETRYETIQEFFEIIQNKDIKSKVREVYLGENIQIDNVNCKVLAIKNSEITENAGNNQSMVVKFNVGGKSILFLGDAGEEEGNKLLNMFPNELKSDIVQMAHHGQAGVSKEVYEKISPEICLWPTPDWLWNNDNGSGEDSGEWKTKETRSWMDEITNVKQHYVGKDGDYKIKIY